MEIKRVRQENVERLMSANRRHIEATRRVISLNSTGVSAGRQQPSTVPPIHTSFGGKEVRIAQSLSTPGSYTNLMEVKWSGAVGHIDIAAAAAGEGLAGDLSGPRKVSSRVYCPDQEYGLLQLAQKSSLWSFSVSKQRGPRPWINMFESSNRAHSFDLRVGESGNPQPLQENVHFPFLESKENPHRRSFSFITYTRHFFLPPLGRTYSNFSTSPRNPFIALLFCDLHPHLSPCLQKHYAKVALPFPIHIHYWSFFPSAATFNIECELKSSNFENGVKPFELPFIASSRRPRSAHVYHRRSIIFKGFPRRWLSWGEGWSPQSRSPPHLVPRHSIVIPDMRLVAAQKLNLTSSPHRRKRHSSGEDDSSGTGFSAAIRRTPPPMPPALLRRIGVKEVTGVGKSQQSRTVRQTDRQTDRQTGRKCARVMDLARKKESMQARKSVTWRTEEIITEGKLELLICITTLEHSKM
ncbi:hypothetical protein C0J52_05175 [Blattella germanica]|nr:hypothetical protein C0J52_05175 [Blattella germanica]